MNLRGIAQCRIFERRDEGSFIYGDKGIRWPAPNLPKDVKGGCYMRAGRIHDRERTRMLYDSDIQIWTPRPNHRRQISQPQLRNHVLQMNESISRDGYGFRKSGTSTPDGPALLVDPNGLGWPGAFHLVFQLYYRSLRSQVHHLPPERKCRRKNCSREKDDFCHPHNPGVYWRGSGSWGSAADTGKVCSSHHVDDKGLRRAFSRWTFVFYFKNATMPMLS